MESIDVKKIIALQSHDIKTWRQEGIAIKETGLYALVEENLSNNYQLWYEEDKARRDDKGFEFVYKAKRNIDGFNQQRNNFMEKIDEWVVKDLEPIQDGSVPFNSETPGMMIDRLAILALKEYNMLIQAERQDVTEAHRNECTEKLARIKLQRDDLATCLDNFLKEIEAGTRSFRVYYQFKMYNDPKLNPELYKNSE